MGFFEIWAIISRHKIQKFSTFCPDYIRHAPFLPKFVQITHQGSKFAKIVQIRASGIEKLPMAIRGIRNGLYDSKLAFSYYFKGISPEPLPPPSFVTTFCTPFLLAAFRNFIAYPTCSNFCFSPENISKSFSSSQRVRASAL